MEDNWISVKERLPERIEPLMGYNDQNELEVIIDNNHAQVMAYSGELGTFKAKYDKFGWSEISSIAIKKANPTHWMPLPNPPKV